jgi:hypothetical protein
MANADEGTEPDVAAVVGVDLSTGEDLARAAHALARRFAAGATMWCLAPEWPEHARHVAVEFVHPVIMGKRALPAVSVVDPDPVSALRATVKSGDILVGVSGATDRAMRSAMLRCGPWGLTSVWIGAGPPPQRGGADHVVWLDDPDGTAPHDGRLVLLYHVLWELTHVCFEHPGLLAPYPTSGEEGPACTTCSDEGRLAEVVSVIVPNTATVRTPKGLEVIDTTVVPPVQGGDLVIVHAGAAIAVLEPAEHDG